MFKTQEAHKTYQIQEAQRITRLLRPIPQGYINSELLLGRGLYLWWSQNLPWKSHNTVFPRQADQQDTHIHLLSAYLCLQTHYYKDPWKSKVFWARQQSEVKEELRLQFQSPSISWQNTFISEKLFFPPLDTQLIEWSPFTLWIVLCSLQSTV